MLAPTPTGDEKQVGAAATTDLGCPDAGVPQTEAPPRKLRFARLRAILSRLIRRPRLWAVAALLVLIAAGVAVASPHLWAWYHFRAARNELQRFHNPQAIRHLHACLRIWPHDTDVLLLAAQSARRGRSYSEAERLLEMYQQVRGIDDAGAFEQLLLSVERRMDPQATEMCWRYVEQGHPDAAQILDALTRGYLWQYRLGEARLCLDRWLQDQPDTPQALSLDGLFHLDYTHSRAAAEASYRRAVELDPEHEEARLGLAVALLGGKNFAEAAEHLEYLRRRQPDNLSVLVGLAECYAGLGEEAQAVRLVDEVLAQQPESAPALALRGRLALKNGDSTEAETLLRRAVELNPSDHRARYSLVLCLHQNSKEEEARQQQHRLEQLENDLARFNEIVTKDLLQRPRDPALHCTLGELLLRGGQREQGLRWLQSALQVDPQYAPARQALSEYQHKAKTEPKQPASKP